MIKKKYQVMLLIVLISVGCFYQFHVKSQIPYFYIMNNYYEHFGIGSFTYKNYLFDEERIHYYGYHTSGTLYAVSDNKDPLVFFNLYAQDSYMGDFSGEKENLDDNLDYYDSGIETINGYDLEYWRNEDVYIGYFSIDDGNFRITVENETIEKNEFNAYTNELLNIVLILK